MRRLLLLLLLLHRNLTLPDCCRGSPLIAHIGLSWAESRSWAQQQSWWLQDRGWTMIDLLNERHKFSPLGAFWRRLQER